LGGRFPKSHFGGINIWNKPFLPKFYRATMTAIVFVSAVFYHGGAAPSLMHPCPLSLPLPTLLRCRQLSPLSFAADVVLSSLPSSCPVVREASVAINPNSLRCLLSLFLVVVFFGKGGK
jgi:hypothetical protein